MKKNSVSLRGGSLLLAALVLLANCAQNRPGPPSPVPTSTATATAAPVGTPIPATPTAYARQPKPAKGAGSESSQTPLPSPKDLDVTELVAGNHAFAFDLYHQLKANEGNLLFSPYSISAMAAMAFAGARTGTEQQMASTLHYTLPQSRLHPAFHALAQELARRSEATTVRTGEGFQRWPSPGPGPTFRA